MTEQSDVSFGLQIQGILWPHCEVQCSAPRILTFTALQKAITISVQKNVARPAAFLSVGSSAHEVQFMFASHCIQANI
jgi:hypothetical protein